MSKGILFSVKGKKLTYVFVTLILLLCLMVIGVSYAQSPTAEEIQKMKLIQIINPRPPFSLRLWIESDRGATFAPGEKIKISFQTSQDSYVKIYNYDVEGRVKIIFPNQYSPHNFIRAGQTQSIEGIIDPGSRPGIEYVQGFATTNPVTFNEKEENLISKEFMPQVSPDYKKQTQTMKGIIVSLPPTTWVSGNLLSYTVRPTTPPLPPPANYGRIIVASQPQGARVYLDNVQRGTTPLNLDRVAAGQHQIKLTKTGYQDWSNYVSVSPSQTISVSANLIPINEYGSISISCNQGSAEVFLDGIHRGRTYSSRSVVLENVEKGYHELLVTKIGYQDWSKRISVSSSKTTKTVVNLVSQVLDGSISVYCNQGNAKINLDGNYIKRTSANKSVELNNIAEGYHELLITKNGYQDWVSTIMVKTNQTYMVSAYLAPEMNYNGSIAVYCNVNGAKIFLNGTYKAATLSSQPKILEDITEREYEVTLVKDGYRTWVQDIWVYAGQAASLSVQMNKID